MLDETGDELIVHTLLHQHTRRRHADLAGIAILRRCQQAACGIHIGIVEHDRRCVAAEFHRHALHVRARDGRKLLAHGGGTGERDLADDRMRNEVLGDLGRHAVDQIDHTGRHAGIGKAADQFGR